MRTTFPLPHDEMQRKVCEAEVRYMKMMQTLAQNGGLGVQLPGYKPRSSTVSSIYLARLIEVLAKPGNALELINRQLLFMKPYREPLPAVEGDLAHP